MKFYMLSDGTFYDRIDIVYLFIKPFLDKKKYLYLRNPAVLLFLKTKTSFFFKLILFFFQSIPDLRLYTMAIFVVHYKNTPIQIY